MDIATLIAAMDARNLIGMSLQAQATILHYALTHSKREALDRMYSSLEFAISIAETREQAELLKELQMAFEALREKPEPDLLAIEEAAFVAGERCAMESRK
jgi:hypothetical protein